MKANQTVCSRQIRPPIYSMKQSKLRRRRVVRFAILYFAMVILFVALIVGPIVAGKYIPSSLSSKIPMQLLQPTGQNNDNTLGTNQTGTGAASYLKTASSTATATG
jgi:1,3-beta-glucan synthase